MPFEVPELSNANGYHACETPGALICRTSIFAFSGSQLFGSPLLYMSLLNWVMKWVKVSQSMG